VLPVRKRRGARLPPKGAEQGPPTWGAAGQGGWHGGLRRSTRTRSTCGREGGLHTRTKNAGSPGGIGRVHSRHGHDRHCGRHLAPATCATAAEGVGAPARVPAADVAGAAEGGCAPAPAYGSPARRAAAAAGSTARVAGQRRQVAARSSARWGSQRLRDSSRPRQWRREIRERKRGGGDDSGRWPAMVAAGEVGEDLSH
jgi:hypothetical protein